MKSLTPKTINSSTTHSNITDSSGYYSFEGLNGFYSYTVSKSNYSNSTGTINITADTSKDFYLTPLVPDLLINSSYIEVGPEFWPGLNSISR